MANKSAFSLFSSPRPLRITVCVTQMGPMKRKMQGRAPLNREEAADPKSFLLRLSQNPVRSNIGQRRDVRETLKHAKTTKKRTPVKTLYYLPLHPDPTENKVKVTDLSYKTRRIHRPPRNDELSYWKREEREDVRRNHETLSPPAHLSRQPRASLTGFIRQHKGKNFDSSPFRRPFSIQSQIEYGIERTEKPEFEAPGWREIIDGAGENTCVVRGRNSCPARGREVRGSAQGGYETAAKIRDEALITLRGKGGGREVDEESKGGYTGAAAAQDRAAMDAAAWSSRLVSDQTPCLVGKGDETMSSSQL
ncbi:hypothetical protein L249_6990 [Ophiocordyceps polyrhachis-furcata BCC 54312]|uniref:Uncharacterized protein n=1 Tax=Ophiocordyceps polyrhachis-furcata BCC 54312 TaxID=1330021 RepID=A0A367LKG4_9HYPO|nr:hypothetical protein L249_6990 [Ophiocordyceps polyrhachis-furcata BCC 54312]